MKRILLLVLAAVLVGAACSGDDNTSVETGSDEGGPDAVGTSIEGSWTLVMLVEEGDMAIPPPVGATIDLLIEGSNVGGIGGCNTFDASVEILEDGSFAVGDLSWTAMACQPPEVMERETRYLAALGAATSWSIEEDQLTLAGPDGSLVYERAPDPVDTTLEATLWQLNSFHDGVGLDSSAVNDMGMDAVTLTVSADAATVDTPCGAAAGPAAVDADEQGSIGLALTLDADECTDEERLLVDDALARVGRIDHYEIDESRLILYSGDDPVIGFTAH